MNAILQRLRDRKGHLSEEMKKVADAAADENRAFTAEEEKTWETLNAEYDSVQRKIESQIEGEKRAEAVEKELARFTEKPGEPRPATETSAGDAQQGDPLLRKFCRGEVDTAEFYPKGRFEVRTLSKLTAAAGLNTVPTSFYDQLVAHLIEVSGVLQANPTVLRTDGGESLQVPKTTAHSANASIVAEAGALAANDPTFGQVTLGSFKYGFMIQVSNELLADTGVDLDGYLAQQGGRALGNGIGNHLVNGTGTGQPRGVLADTTAGATGGTGVAGAPSADNLIDLKFSVIEPYRSRGGVWCLKDSTLATIRKLKDSQGRYIWEPNYQVGEPDVILGHPVYTDPFVPAVALSAKSVLFGDFSAYFARFAGGARIERSNEFAFGNDLVTVRFLLRADGATVDTSGAIKHFVGGAT